MMTAVVANSAVADRQVGNSTRFTFPTQRGSQPKLPMVIQNVQQITVYSQQSYLKQYAASARSVAYRNSRAAERPALEYLRRQQPHYRVIDNYSYDIKTGVATGVREGLQANAADTSATRLASPFIFNEQAATPVTKTATSTAAAIATNAATAASEADVSSSTATSGITDIGSTDFTTVTSDTNTITPQHTEDSMSRQRRMQSQVRSWRQQASPDSLSGLKPETTIDTSIADTLWLTQGKLNANGQILTKHLLEAEQHGLHASLYHPDFLHRLQQTTLASAHIPAVDDHLSALFSQFINDLAFGLVDPTQAQTDWYRAAAGINVSHTLEQLREGVVDVDSAITAALPEGDLYQGLQQLRQRLQSEYPAEGYNIVSGPMLKLDSQGPRVEQLREALMATGDLVLTAAHDRFDADLDSAVRAYQKRHGLAVDGIVAEKTLASLAIPAAAHIAHVDIALERARWLPSSFSDTHILVNIPDYRLQLTANQQLQLDMRVIVGSEEHQTPVFSESVKYLDFAPTWTVPRSIVEKEIMPQVRENPDYLQQHNFMIMRPDGNDLVEVDPATIGLEEYHRKRFPYVLRQRPGSRNPLGKVKFMMPNPYAIYMHDTQAKGLFNNDRRAYSHGCIRLAEPAQLAQSMMLIDDKPSINVRSLMSQNVTERVLLNEPVEFHLDYRTVWLDPTGKAQYREDIYQHNAGLSAALEAALVERRLQAAMTVLPTLGDEYLVENSLVEQVLVETSEFSTW